MSDRGSAYVFTRSGTAWTQATKLVAADGAAGHRFGHAVALDAGTAVIGAPGDGRGSARVFVGAGSNWTPQATLAALAAANTDNFGTSVAVSGDTAIAGSLYDNIGGLSSVGSAFAFVRNGSLWSEHARLEPDGSLPDRRPRRPWSCSATGSSETTRLRGTRGRGSRRPGPTQARTRHDCSHHAADQPVEAGAGYPCAMAVPPLSLCVQIPAQETSAGN